MPRPHCWSEAKLPAKTFFAWAVDWPFRAWVAAQPVWGGRVVGVEILNEIDFRLETSALPFPLLVRSGEVEGKVRWLERLLPWLVAEWGEPAAVDLRFARRIVVDGTVAEMSDRSPGRGA